MNKSADKYANELVDIVTDYVSSIEKEYSKHKEELRFIVCPLDINVNIADLKKYEGIDLLYVQFMTNYLYDIPRIVGTVDLQTYIEEESDANSYEVAMCTYESPESQKQDLFKQKSNYKSISANKVDNDLCNAILNYSKIVFKKLKDLGYDVITSKESYIEKASNYIDNLVDTTKNGDINISELPKHSLESLNSIGLEVIK